MVEWLRITGLVMSRFELRLLKSSGIFFFSGECTVSILLPQYVNDSYCYLLDLTNSPLLRIFQLTNGVS